MQHTRARNVLESYVERHALHDVAWQLDELCKLSEFDQKYRDDRFSNYCAEALGCNMSAAEKAKVPGRVYHTKYDIVNCAPDNNVIETILSDMKKHLRDLDLFPLVTDMHDSHVQSLNLSLKNDRNRLMTSETLATLDSPL